MFRERLFTHTLILFVPCPGERSHFRRTSLMFSSHQISSSLYFPSWWTSFAFLFPLLQWIRLLSFQRRDISSTSSISWLTILFIPVLSSLMHEDFVEENAQPWRDNLTLHQANSWRLEEMESEVQSDRRFHFSSSILWSLLSTSTISHSWIWTWSGAFPVRRSSPLVALFPLKLLCSCKHSLDLLQAEQEDESEHWFLSKLGQRETNEQHPEERRRRVKCRLWSRRRFSFCRLDTDPFDCRVNEHIRNKWRNDDTNESPHFECDPYRLNNRHSHWTSTHSFPHSTNQLNNRQIDRWSASFSFLETDAVHCDCSSFVEHDWRDRVKPDLARPNNRCSSSTKQCELNEEISFFTHWTTKRETKRPFFLTSLCSSSRIKGSPEERK